MVTKWGLSEKMGPLMYEEDEGEVFLGRSVTQRKNVSAQTAMDIDNEIRAIIDRCYDRAKQILVENRDKLEMMADALMQYETIDASQIDDIMAGRKPQPPKGWTDGGSSAAKPEPVPEEKAAVVAEKPVDHSAGLPPLGGAPAH
jgi:cell division protease FtsH